MKCHAATPATTVSAVTVEYEMQQEGQLWLRYCVEGDTDNLVLPKHTDPKRTDGLWDTSCFELFLRHTDMPNYFEFNFSPSSQWAAYHFDTYRTGMAIWDTSTPEIHTEASDTHYALEATISLPAGEWEAALSAVIHERGDIKSYWALNHADGPPDFHHRDCFALKLAPPLTL